LHGSSVARLQECGVGFPSQAQGLAELCSMISWSVPGVSRKLLKLLRQHFVADAGLGEEVEAQKLSYFNCVKLRLCHNLN